MNPTDELLFFNGIDAATGRYLRPPRPVSEVQTPELGDVGPPAGIAAEALAKSVSDLRYWTTDTDPARLEESGWGVIFPYEADRARREAVREALSPLLDRRRAEAAARSERLFRDDLVYRPGDTLHAFLERHGVGPGPVDPEKIPYYLLLVGDPESIPYDFQLRLDVQYAVGRVSFDSLEELAGYSEKVARTESLELDREPRVTFFGAAHRGDPATEDALEHLVRRLARRLEKARRGCRVELVAESEATKDRLSRLLAGEERPDVLFTSSHGLALPTDPERQRDLQGALVTSDWPGPANGTARPPTPEQYFAASDVVPGAVGGGTICFLHGCYTAGTPRLESFSRRYHREPLAQAPRDFVSRLSQRLLAAEHSALAVIGHVDQTWTSSYLWKRAGAQTQTFESALKEIVDGHPVGLAMESFGLRYAELATALTSALEQGRGASGEALLWTFHNDARNFVVVGDPAVRLGPRRPVATEAPSAAVLSSRGPVSPSRPRLRTPVERPENLEIRVFPDGDGGYRCSLTVGSQSKSARIELSRGDVAPGRIYDDVVEQLSSAGSGVRRPAMVPEVGAALFEALFPGPLRSFLERTRERFEGRPLRLLFRLDPESRSRAFLSSLPWEWLYWRERQDFLSLNRRSPVVRYVEVDAPPPPTCASGRLRVLVITSERSPAPPILAELEKIETALADHPTIDVELLRGVSLAALREAFEGEGFHVVHFIGHGLYARQKASAHIVLEDDQGWPYPLSGEDLAQTLRDFTMLRLVFFNSCDTARSDESGARPFAGVAHAMLQNGVPAVVAMQFPISHGAATAFSERLYYALAEGDGIDAAVAEGRQAIHAQRPGSIEWGTPVLFVRTTDLEILARPGKPPRFSPHLAVAAALFFLVLFAAFASWPSPSEAEVDISLRTSYVRFRLADREQPVIENFFLKKLGASNLREIQLPDSAVAGEKIVSDSGRLGVLLEITGSDTIRGAISLHQELLPPATYVAIRREEGAEGAEYRLSFDTADGFGTRHGFEASVEGPFKMRLLGLGAKSPLEATASAPEELNFHPRSSQFDLDVSFLRFEGKELRTPITIDELELFEIAEVATAEETRLEPSFSIAGGKVKIISSGESHKLSDGIELRVGVSSGSLYDVDLNEKGIALGFQGSVTRLEEGVGGGETDLMPRRGVFASAMSVTAAFLAALNAALAAVLVIKARLSRVSIQHSYSSIKRMT